MSIYIPVIEIKRFFEAAKNIKSAGSFLSILDYLLFEGFGGHASISKSNMASFCTYLYDFESAPFKILIDEKILINLIKDSSSDLVYINVLEKYTELSDDKTTIRFSPSGTTKDFPYCSIPEGVTATKFNKEIITSISVAKNYTVKGSTENSCSFVYLVPHNGLNVCATLWHTFYFKNFSNQNIQSACLPVELCSVLSAFENIDFSSDNKYYYLSAPQVEYGFTQNIYSTPDFKSLMGRQVKHFQLNALEIVSFCNLVKSTNRLDSFHDIELKETEEGCILTYNNPTRSINLKTRIDCIKSTPIGKIRFDAGTAIAALSPLSYESIVFELISGHLFMRTDEDHGWGGAFPTLK